MNSKLQQLKNELQKVLHFSAVSDDPDILEKYSVDETSDLKGNPWLVVYAKTTSDVSTVLSLCNQYRIPVIPRGAGTGVTGGAVPVCGGIVLSLEKMNQILEIDTENMIAVCQPGVITGQLQKEALQYGLMYPPDPASLDSCSLGGNVAEGAGGPRAVKYGTTKDYITGLEFVLADGSVLHHGGKFIKNATGYNLTGILIGSEGTLAIITKIYCKLIPAPALTLDMLIPFDSLTHATQFVYTLLTHRVQPAVLEFMEEDALTLAAQYLKEEMPHPHARAHLLIQLDGDSYHEIEPLLQKILSLCPVNPEDILVAQSPEQKERLWKARRCIREAIHAKSPVFLAEDCSIPRSSIVPFLTGVKEALTPYRLQSIMFGHAGDGNVHIDVLKNDMPYEKFKNLVPVLKEIIYGLAYKYGGTITGEHGTGFIRKEALKKFASEAELSLYKRLKKAFDPYCILNPYKIIDPD
ncbi:MAG: FAD-binding oxidoreductase [Spirochaetes bacterium]|nr:FAD-binding oxidoreductase [Spirochaetota bacterium]